MYLHVQSVLLQYQIYYMFITAPITFNLLIVTFAARTAKCFAYCSIIYGRICYYSGDKM